MRIRPPDPAGAESRSGKRGGPAAKSAQPAADPRSARVPLPCGSPLLRPVALRASHSRRDLPASRSSTGRQAKPVHSGGLDVWPGMTQILAPSGRKDRATVPVAVRAARGGSGQKDSSPSSRAIGGPVPLPVERPRNPRGGATGISDTIDGGWPLTPHPPRCMARNQNWRPSYCRG